MQYTLALLALAASAVAAPQGVTSAISPAASAPAGCSASHSGSFEITVMNVTTSASKKRSVVEKRQKAGVLTLTLNNGQLKDQDGRTGYIASNYQFQFDNPPQAGAIYTDGFSYCGNGSLALGGSAIFYECYSGGIYNLYDRHWAPQCSAIYIEAIGASGAAASQSVDGQPGVTTQVTEKTDGQPNAVTQISDGQVQGNPAPVTQISDGQIQGPKSAPPAPVTQISDGQPQAPTKSSPVAPVTQISDGQPQAPTSVPKTTVSPVTQISDGQPQANTGAPVTQISDGQVQGGSSTTASTTASPVTQISDGQVQANTGVPAVSTPVYSGNDAPIRGAQKGLAGLVVGLAGAFALL